MAAVVSALDTHGLQCGENGHVEHTWSQTEKEKILQLSFQLTRTSDSNRIKQLGEMYRNMVIKSIDENGRLYEIERASNGVDTDKVVVVDILYRLMLHTRDIVKGKGEYALFYELLSRWAGISHFCKNKKIAEMAKLLTRKAISSLIKLDDDEHGYGSWKDMKYILNKLKERFNKNYSEMDAYHYIIHIMKNQLQMDEASEESAVSLLGRWAPRESSKPFGWIARPLSEAIYSDWMESAVTPKQKIAASLKCRVHYRKLLSKLNNKLNTPQVKMCNKDWQNINFDKDVTSITLSRNKRAFEYVDKKGLSRGTNEDRVECRNNYKNYVARCKSGETDIKAARVSLVDMVKDAISLSNHHPTTVKTQLDTVNEQWKTSGKQIGNLGNFVCMVDTSGSMECDGGNPLAAAIGLGLRASEKSILGDRVMTFSSYPKWLNLDGFETFVDKVRYLKNDSSWGNSTNFKAALQMIADACVEKNVPPHEVKNLVLAIFSDMQIDVADSSARTMDEDIRKMFHDAGLRSKFKKPYQAPHRLFWNLRTTDGFPCLSVEKNTSMMSGFSPSLLNSFQEKGMEVLENYTPWNMMLDQLEDQRYIWTKSVISTAATNPIPLTPVSELASIYETPQVIDSNMSKTSNESTSWFSWY